jgi:hypothetical protein
LNIAARRSQTLGEAASKAPATKTQRGFQTK